ncbi:MULTISPECIES: hypothetical protein [Bacteroidota]|uniref:hypothetical protein n=1 Tax=Bacteroidota TaxID=976 RepID=UPI000F5939FD|nr:MULTISPECIES: hypothetical protein [Bacteroidota]
MKKIISIISTIITILAGIVFMHSCRQQDDDQALDQDFKIEKSGSKLSNRNADSLQQASNTDEFGVGEFEYKDPPPKNGGQWKINK